MQRLNKRLFLTERPATFARQNDGQETVLYNFNIEAGEQNTGEEAKQGYYYDSLRVSYPLTQRNVLATLLGVLYPADVEMKLQNDFNAVAVGMESLEKKQAYIDFLNHRKQLKAMVVSDCQAAGVPEDTQVAETYEADMETLRQQRLKEFDVVLNEFAILIARCELVSGRENEGLNAVIEQAKLMRAQTVDAIMQINTVEQMKAFHIRPEDVDALKLLFEPYK
ncbi:hypothetical protein [Gaoshiqia sediminis]|uniref:Uncharacterized protein n=1 Tax=Gaoshiqia sediminis TaxID=2986998 RepID=A0AA41Y8Y9_9BACT|nr:hypothetical protein [Gaoshiqia sediminis]MCW0484080.1 hypothetical protein [Gaoshiqia sediminis]